jgi:hypothetical protein
MTTRIVKRDLELLRKANGYGAVSIEGFAEIMHVKYSTGARRARALINADLLARLPVPLLGVAGLVVTKAGCIIANDPLRPPEAIRLGTWVHDQLLVKVGCALERRLAATFEPERRIRFRLGDNANFHLPDGYVWRNGKAPVAVELELTKKSPRRLAQIVGAHRADMSIAGVIYVVPDDTMVRYVRRFVVDDPKFFRVVRLDALLQPTAVVTATEP